MSGTANEQIQLGTMLADWLGMHHRSALALEAACGSGSAAFRAAVMAVGAGEINSALVVGVEKMTDSPSSEITSALATAADTELEGEFGVSFIALNALIMQRYMFDYGWKTSDFAAFSINAHANGVNNPYARFQKAITRESFEKAGMICDPINLMDASPIGDGAAAILITSTPTNSGFPRVKVSASSAATDTISVQHRKKPIWLSAAEASSREAYRQSGCAPESKRSATVSCAILRPPPPCCSATTTPVVQWPPCASPNASTPAWPGGPPRPTHPPRRGPGRPSRSMSTGRRPAGAIP